MLLVQDRNPGQVRWIAGGVCAPAFVYAALGVPAQEETGNDIVIGHVSVFDGESMVNKRPFLITNGKVSANGASLTVGTDSVYEIFRVHYGGGDVRAPAIGALVPVASSQLRYKQPFPAMCSLSGQRTSEKIP